MGAVNVHGNARSVARVLPAIARGGEVDGVRLLGPDTIDHHPTAVPLNPDTWV